MSTPRTLIIGLDGATFDLIDPLAAQGRLPNLSRLMSEGSRAVLRAFPNMNSASAWSSIVTGCNPGKHGVYDFGDSPNAGKPGWRPITARNRRRDPFWRILSDAGRKVGVFNVPISYPADPINGWMISGMDAPGPASPGFTQPPGLIADLRSAGINYVLDVPNLGAQHQRNPFSMPQSVRDMVTARARTVSYFIERQQPDAVIVVFTATDRMQHFYWGDGSVEQNDRTWQPISELYQLVDEWIGRLCSQCGPACNVIVVSDHGFGLAQPASAGVNRLLAQLGWLHYRTGPAGGQTLRERTLAWMLKTGRRWLPGRLQYAGAVRFPALRQQALRAQSFGGIDWPRTRVYFSRYGGGVITEAPLADASVASLSYDSVCEQVSAVIMKVVDPQTGRPVAKRVWRRSELYSGPSAGSAPDLHIEWDEDALGEQLCYPDGQRTIITGGRPRGLALRGRHRSEGIFIARGPDVRQGVVLPSITHYDVAPTILYLQDAPIPQDVDGQVLVGMLSEQSLASRPVRLTQRQDSSTSSTEVLSEAETRIIEQRLRDLGYL